MGKTNKSGPAAAISKGIEKSEGIVLKFTSAHAIKAVLCFAMEFSGVFASMSPFGIGFYVSVFKQESWIANYIAAMLGIILSGKSYFWTYAIVLTALTAIMAISDKMSKSPAIKAAVSCGVFIVLGAVRYLRGSFVAFDIMALILEGIFMGTGVIVFSYGFDILINMKKRSFISEKEAICAYATLAIAILSLQSLPVLAGIDLASVVSMTVIFTLCLAGSPRSALSPAILLGIISAMGPGGRSSIMGTFAFGALLAGSLRGYGKPGVVLGFIIANTASSLFLADADQIVLGIYDSLAAALIFAFIPGSVIRYFSLLSSKTDTSYAAQKADIDRSESPDGLRRMSESLKKLSEIYEDAGQQRIIGQSYIKSSLALVREKICAGCPMKDRCYNDEDGYAYEAVRKYITVPAVPVNASTLDDKLKNICHRRDGFAAEAKTIVHMLRNESQWLCKTAESRKLISDQLKGISKAIQKESAKLGNRRDSQLEEKLWSELDKDCIYPESVTAEAKNGEDFEIRIRFDQASLSKNLAKQCKACVDAVIPGGAEFGGAGKSNGKVTLAYYQSCGYSASFGYATKAKVGEKINGDSFNVIYTDRSRMIMALSDGMGSGKVAAKESRLVISLLESFLQAGFDCDTAVGLINSSLLLKGARESFATLDICDINLPDATLTFTKLGATDAYIKTGSKTQRINAGSLPAGILREAKAEKHMLPIASDCVVVLVSDGVADIALKNQEHSGWLEKELSGLAASNPQIIAAKLLDTALRLTDNTAADDMTVIAACISKNN